MKKTSLVFATHNPNKVKEIKAFAPDTLDIKSLEDYQWTTPIPETGNTLEANAWIKANTVFDTLGLDCFADDSGLEIDALDGQPGVYSARFAGEPVDASKNMDKVLKLMEKHSARKAQFRTVIALHWKGERYTFEGFVRGSIGREKQGNGGFGYDPIFIPEGYDQTFAQLSPEIKNTIGHRGKALAKMNAFLHEVLLPQDSKSTPEV